MLAKFCKFSEHVSYAPKYFMLFINHIFQQRSKQFFVIMQNFWFISCYR